MQDKKHLVVTVCPKCGETMIIFTNLSVLHCKCGEHIKYHHSELKNGQYQCPNCGKTTYFKVLGEVKDLKCKTCESWIDLKWHKKYKKYLSLNLI